MSLFKIIFFCFGFVLPSLKIKAQVLFNSDIINGGVTGGGFSTNSGSGLIETEVFIPPGSIIKRAYLLASCDGLAPNLTVTLNGDNYTLDESHIVSPFFVSRIHPSWTWSNSTIRVLDVLSTVQPDVNLYSLNIPPQSNIVVNGFYSSFYLFIVFENPMMNAVGYNVFLNSQNVDPLLQYNLSMSLQISTTADVGLGVWTTFFGDTIIDGSFVELNSLPLGLLGGTESNTPFTYTGVYPNFSYSNGILLGLEDDIPNGQMAATDALAEASTFFNENDNSCDLTFIYQSPNNIDGPYSNPVIGIFLTYTSPCQPFNAALLTSDTTTCAFVPVQLGASGGTSTGSAPAYEWLPQQNLSCYDCPNPIFTGNTTTNYTVRIRNTDSCSVVYPVRVRVLPNPSFESIEITESVCGGATGSIEARPVSGAEPPHTFQINGGTPQNNGDFNNLAAGEYTVTVTNAVGCYKDSVVVVGEFNNVQAAFSVDPTTGAAPLTLQTQNNSQNATQYQWSWEDESSTLINPSITLDTSGVYTLTLVAGNGTPHCNDTTSLQIFVYDSLQLVIPNVFTPNSDGTNDWFGITSNIPISGKIVLLNRWGNVVQEKSFNTQANTFEPLWDGVDASEGVYFYRIFEILGKAGEVLVLDKEAEFQGFVHLER